MTKDEKPNEELKVGDALAQLNFDSELTEGEKLKIEAEARAEVTKEMKAAKVKEFKEAAKRRLKMQALFSDGKDEHGEGTESITLNLSPVQPHVCLDGKRYYHGRTYTVSRGVMQVLKDQMFRGWKEESARLGEDMNAFYGRQKMNAAIGPQGMRRLQ